MSEQLPLRFVLGWIDTEEGEPVHTMARLSVWLHGRPIWPAAGQADVALDIYVDDLLSHLTEFWKPLMLRQTYPIAETPDRPGKLRATAEKRWMELPPAIIDKEDEKLTAFEQAHDLSRAFSGLFGLPSPYLFRTGERMLVDTPWRCQGVSFVAAGHALAEVGEKIAQRLDSVDPAKWSDLVRSWRSRDVGEPTRLLAWATSLTADVARSLVEEGFLRAPTTVSDAANDDDELSLAARMSSALLPEQIRQILTLVRGFHRHSADPLDRLATAAAHHVQAGFAEHRPFEQGEAAATFVREYLGLASVQRVDVFDLIATLGIELRTPPVEPSSLEGLAVWGPKHGPAVLINPSSARVAASSDLAKSGAARVTAAHEVCHLLLDRGHALTAVDVLNSKMPAAVESRAKAFAGEFLLPGRVAADLWRRKDQPRTPHGLLKLVQHLCKTYGVTRSVASWKLEHGLNMQDIDLGQQLDQVVPQRWQRGA